MARLCGLGPSHLGASLALAVTVRPVQVPLHEGMALTARLFPPRLGDRVSGAPPLGAVSAAPSSGLGRFLARLNGTWRRGASLRPLKSSGVGFFGADSANRDSESRMPVSIVGRVRMSLGAGFPGASTPPPRVFLVGHRLQVQGINAHAMLAAAILDVTVGALAMAGVVKLQPAGNGSHHQLIRDPMGRLPAAIEPHGPVSTAGLGADPSPAIIRAEHCDVCPELGDLSIEVHEINSTSGFRRDNRP